MMNLMISLLSISETFRLKNNCLERDAAKVDTLDSYGSFYHNVKTFFMAHFVLLLYLSIGPEVQRRLPCHFYNGLIVQRIE